MLLRADRWKVLKFDSAEFGVVYKLLVGFYGGYTGSDSWWLNSGIEVVVEKEGYYNFHGKSGSVYSCPKSAEGFTGLMLSVLEDWQRQIKEQAMEATIEVIDYEDFNAIHN